MTLDIALIRFPHAAHLQPPAYATEEAAGMDLQAALDIPYQLEPGKHALIPTGFGIAVPIGYEAQIRPRSGLAAKHGVTVLNSPGTIDSDYRGEIKVILINLGAEPFTIEPGMRIAQMVVAAHERAQWQLSGTLPETIRGVGGFGSTGTKR